MLVLVRVQTGKESSELIPIECSKVLPYLFQQGVFKNVNAVDRCFIAKLKSKPVDNKANGELIKLVKSKIGKNYSKVTIIKGKRGKIKLIKLQGA